MTLILPHESVWLQEKLFEANQRNLELSDAMRSAIENGNAWHDNAEYDDTIEAMQKFDIEVRPFVELDREAEVITYPTGDRVQIGSALLLEASFGLTNLLIVGSLLLGSDSYQQKWQQTKQDGVELEVSGTESILVQATLGNIAGSTVYWTVGKNSFNAHIRDVDNMWLANNFGPCASLTSPGVPIQ